MSALAAFRTAVLALLDDPTSARYSSAQIDQALRWALNEYATARPLINTYQLDSTGYALIILPSDFTARYITKVELYNEDPDQVEELAHYAYLRDNGWALETIGRSLPVGEVLTITYATSHSIDDLDGAAGTTLPSEDEVIVQVGAAGYAAQMRASSRAESVNLQVGLSKQLLEVAGLLMAAFRAAIRPLAEARIIAPGNFPVEG
jgi:hypothetical protein